MGAGTFGRLNHTQATVNIVPWETGSQAKTELAKLTKASAAAFDDWYSLII
jgi:hypothetical protein